MEAAGAGEAGTMGLQTAVVIAQRGHDGGCFPPDDLLPRHQETRRVGIEVDGDGGTGGLRVFAGADAEKGMGFHAWRLGGGEWAHDRSAVFLGSSLQIADGMGVIELGRGELDRILAAHDKHFMLRIQCRPVFHVVRMNGNKADLVFALDPAHRIDVMALAAGYPDIMLPVANPASGMAHSPAVFRPARNSDQRVLPGNRIPGKAPDERGWGAWEIELGTEKVRRTP